jgi:hypothetical protein
MISERQLARGFAVKWQEWAPNLNAAFLSDVGSPAGPCARFSRRWDGPMDETGTPRLNDLIAEVAFGLFSECLEGGSRPERLPPETRSVILERATARIAVLRRTQADLGSQLNPRSIGEADQLALRLLEYFKVWVGIAEIQPLLAGVGILNSCHPDLIYGDAIVEIKMGISPFRCGDIRQLLIYCALLRHTKPERHIRRLCLLNPRRGMAWEFPLEALIQLIAGNCVQDFFREILEFLCGEGPAGLGWDEGA